MSATICGSRGNDKADVATLIRLRAHVRFTAKATELLRRREMTRCANCGNWAILIRRHPCLWCSRAPCTRLSSSLLDEDMFPGSIGLNVVYRRVGKSPLYVSVGLGYFGMCAEIVAKYEQC